jgi:hypothetical protein
MLWHFSGSTNAISDRHRIRRTLGLTFLFGGVLMMTLTGCDSEAMTDQGASDRETALRVLGTDARMMAYVDVENQIALTREMAERNGELAQVMDSVMKRVLDETGIRVEEDVHGIYVAIQDFTDNAEGGALAFVEFDQDRATSVIKQTDEFVRLDTQWPVDAFTVEDGGEAIAVAFVEGRLVMLATSSTRLQAMLDHAYAESGRPEMDPLMEAVADRDSWMIIRHLDEYASDFANAEVDGEAALLKPLMTSLQDVAIGVDQDSESMDSRILIRPISAVEVEDYARLITGARALMRMQVRELPAAQGLIDDIDIRSEDGWVRVDMEVNLDDIEEIGAQLREEMGLSWN